MTEPSSRGVHRPGQSFARRVVVVGGGISGLSAAHELVERGYEVEVVEVEGIDPIGDERQRPLVGGMAKTSWAYIRDPSPTRNPRPFQTKSGGRVELPEGGGHMTALRVDNVPPPVRVRLDYLNSQDFIEVFEPGAKEAKSVPPKRDQAGDAVKPSKPGGWDEDASQLSRALELALFCLEYRLRLSVVICSSRIARRQSVDADTPAAVAAAAQERFPPDVQKHIDNLIKSIRNTKRRPVGVRIGDELPIDVHVVRTPSVADGFVQFAADVDRVPGEHGFRFFPSFYRHLFDSMRRIPLPQPAIQAPPVPGISLTEDSVRTVFDNLVSAEVFQLALEAGDAYGGALRNHGRTYEVPRRPLRSLREVREFFENVLERGGYRGKDIARLAAKYLQYLTSSPERRRSEYENISWSDFLELEAPGRYSEYFARHVEGAAQALVAMSTDTNDARTIGSIAMQLTLDQARYNGYSDGTLNGPTSVALLWPWEEYLRSQGVRFTCAELVGFEAHGIAVRPVFGRPAGEDRPYGYYDISPADYYVITIPVNRFQDLFHPDSGEPAHAVTFRSGEKKERVPLLTRARLLEVNAAHEAAEARDAKRSDVQKYLEFERFDIHREETSAFRTMAGIQFYFDSDLRVVKGHTMCQDSPWGVSYLSQAQYWQDRERGQSGFRGVISAIFTRFTVPARGKDDKSDEKPAIECSPAEIAERVWKQITDAWPRTRHASDPVGTQPEPKYFFLDPSLQPILVPNEDAYNRSYRNTTPYLVNRFEDWEKARGGRRLPEGDYVYDVALGHTVFAGVFMRTATRLNTMEAANESARRAVNAILDKDKSESQRCALFNPEDYEVDDLQPLVDHDRRLFERGRPHMMSGPVAEFVLRAFPWDLMRLGFTDPEQELPHAHGRPPRASREKS